MIGVGAEVHDDLVNPGRVGQDGAAPRIDVLPDVNGGGDSGAQEFQVFLDDVLQFERAELLAAPAAEGEDLLHQILGAEPGFQHFTDVIRHGTVLGEAFPGDLRIADDRCQDIVEIMGNTAGQGADGLHFLGLSELVLQFDFLLNRAL